MASAGPVTEQLSRWRAGDPGALEPLLPLVYDELRRVARQQLRRETPCAPQKLRATDVSRQAARGSTRYSWCSPLRIMLDASSLRVLLAGLVGWLDQPGDHRPA